VNGLGIARVEGFEVTSVESEGLERDALLQAGSVSKAVAALVALRLVEQGLLSLDADVNEQLTSWRLPADGPVTLRELLSHSAGTTVESFPGYAPGEPFPSPADVLEGRPPANTDPVRVEPGAGGVHRYSGGGYAVVQALVAEATGLPFATAAAELVLYPLGMGDSTFEQPLPEALQARAAGPGNVYPEAAAAGLWTTPRDLALFGCALQVAVAGRPSPVARETAALMLLPHVELGPREEYEQIRALGLVPPDHMGLGLFLVVEGGETARFGHIGTTNTFVTAIDFSATDGTGAVAMANTHEGAEAVLRAVAPAEAHA
jgi:CubicO group peptidase (beta-lactamase class C family)